jgi:hypothetical protein
VDKLALELVPLDEREELFDAGIHAAEPGLRRPFERPQPFFDTVEPPFHALEPHLDPAGSGFDTVEP